MVIAYTDVGAGVREAPGIAPVKIEDIIDAILEKGKNLI